MDIEEMETEEIVRYLSTRYESLICAGATLGRAGSVTVGTYLKGRECMPYVMDDVEKKVEDFLEEKPQPPKGGGQFRVIK